jgi:WD40 repeat protein
LTTHVLKGHEDEVYTIAFSSDGKTLVSGGGNNDPTVRIWTLKECGNKVVEQEQGTATVEDNGILALPEHAPPQTTQAMYTMVVLKGHRKWVRAVDFSPDGALAVSASGDHTVRVWDLATEKTRHEFIGHTNEVFATSFSSDGLYVLSGSKDETICVWCVTTGALLHTLDCTNHELISVRFSSQHSQGKGFRIVAEGWDKTVRVWELNATQYTCVYVSLPEHPLPLSYVEDVKNQSIFDRAINLKAVVKADAPVGLNVGGVYARSHIDGKTAVAQDFERLHFLQFIPSPMALQQQERSTQGAQ